MRKSRRKNSPSRLKKNLIEKDSESKETDHQKNEVPQPKKEGLILEKPKQSRFLTFKFAFEEFLNFTLSPSHLKVISLTLFYFLKEFKIEVLYANLNTIIAFLLTLSGRKFNFHYFIPFVSSFFDALNLGTGPPISVPIHKILIKNDYPLVLMISLIKFSPTLKIASQFLLILDKIIDTLDPFVHSLLNHVLFIISQQYPSLVENLVTTLPSKFAAPILFGLPTIPQLEKTNFLFASVLLLRSQPVRLKPLFKGIQSILSSSETVHHLNDLKFISIFLLIVAQKNPLFISKFFQLYKAFIFFFLEIIDQMTPPSICAVWKLLSISKSLTQSDEPLSSKLTIQTFSLLDKYYIPPSEESNLFPSIFHVSLKFSTKSLYSLLFQSDLTTSELLSRTLSNSFTILASQASSLIFTSILHKMISPPFKEFYFVLLREILRVPNLVAFLPSDFLPCTLR